MTDLLFARNQSSAEDICAHLLICDAIFTPRLSARVSIADYADRLAAKAERSEAWQGGRLVGLVATYCNAPDKKAAYVTNVSVDPDFQRQGIARRLMLLAIDAATDLGFAEIVLEVGRQAKGAIGLYTGLDFALLQETDMTMTMSRKLEGRER